MSQCRKCGTCGESKPLDQFTADKARPDGRSNRCKMCTAAAMRASRSRRGEPPAYGRVCPQCGTSFVARRSHAIYCSKKCGNRHTWREVALRTKYGITQERHDELLAEQGGGCAICGRTENPEKLGGWHVDHDHRCCPGKRSCGQCVRGLLCGNCNRGLGLFRDDPELIQRAIDYLTR